VRPHAERLFQHREPAWHDDSFPGREASAGAPGVRSLGQKRDHRSREERALSNRWTRSFPRTRRRPARRVQDPRNGPA
jgi:hypothetical protein